MKREDNWTIDKRSYRLYDKKYGIPGYFSAICVIWVRYGGNMLVIYFYTYFQVILRVICKQYPGHLHTGNLHPFYGPLFYISTKAVRI